MSLNINVMLINNYWQIKLKSKQTCLPVVKPVTAEVGISVWGLVGVPVREPEVGVPVREPEVGVPVREPEVGVPSVDGHGAGQWDIVHNPVELLPSGKIPCSQSGFGLMPFSLKTLSQSFINFLQNDLHGVCRVTVSFWVKHGGVCVKQ